MIPFGFASPRTCTRETGDRPGGASLTANPPPILKREGRLPPRRERRGFRRLISMNRNKRVRWESLIFGVWIGECWYTDDYDVLENRAFAIWIVFLQTLSAIMLLGFWYPKGTLINNIALACGWIWILTGFVVFGVYATVLYVDRVYGTIDFILSCFGRPQLLDSIYRR